MSRIDPFAGMIQRVWTQFRVAVALLWPGSPTAAMSSEGRVPAWVFALVILLLVGAIIVLAVLLLVPPVPPPYT